jgi:iron(III) transport system permease protein
MGAPAGLLGEAAPPARMRRGIGDAPVSLRAIAVVVALAVVLPAAYLAVILVADPLDALAEAFSASALAALGRTLLLAATVTLAALALALPLGWLTVRTDLPARRLWATLCTLPIVVPSYVGAYLIVAALGPNGLLADALGVDSVPSIYGFGGAWVVLTLFTFPLMLLPIRSALRRIDPQLEDAARSMGRTPAQIAREVVLPQLVPAIATGSLLVSLLVMSDFGAVSILRFETITQEIYVSYRSAFDRTATASLAGLLVLVMIVLLWLSARVRRRAVVHRSNPGAIKPPVVYPLGRWKAPAIAFCSVVVLFALLIPLAVLIYWSTKGIEAGALSRELVAALAGNSLITGLGAALLGGCAAFALALYSTRWPSAGSRLLERMGHAGYALPGIIVALALVYFATRVALPLYQTLALLIFALAIHYLPLAMGPIASSIKQVPPRLEEAAATMGRSRTQVFATVTAPLVRGGIAAGLALLFLHAVKELPATLILAPIGFETLATEIWNQTSFGFFEASALPSLVLLLVAAPPLYLLSERGVGER